MNNNNNFKTTVSIIGTAGRKQNERNKMTKELFDTMVIQAEEIIKNKWNLSPENITLVSGGAAWSDHVAIRLFLSKNNYNFSGLTLHLPTQWDCGKSEYIDSGVWNWKTNPGKNANYYHHQFSKTIEANSLNEINLVKSKDNVEFKVHNGFHQRNSYVAKSDYLIAFTWAIDDKSITGGSKDTWNKCKSKNKIHINLNNILLPNDELGNKKRKQYETVKLLNHRYEKIRKINNISQKLN